MTAAPNAIFAKDKPVLISFAMCPFAQRSAILLKAKKQHFERVNIDLYNKPDWFLERSPKGKIPVLLVNHEDESIGQTAIFESAVINEYLDESYGDTMLPDSALARAEQRAWINYSEEMIFTQYHAFAAKDEQQAEEHSQKLFDMLIKVKPGTEGYFLGNRLTLVDAAFAPLLLRTKWMTSFTEKLKTYSQENERGKNLIKWIENLQQLPEVTASMTPTFDEEFEEHFNSMGSVIMGRATEVA